MENGRYENRARPVQFRPGHVFWMPRAATWLNRDKPRPFVLITNCSAGSRGSLIYGSTRDTEARHGAACIRVEPRARGINRNGLVERTGFYPGILVRRSYERFPSHAGMVEKSLPELKSALREALGIGRGSCRSLGASPGSRRGRIVRLEQGNARDLRTPFAVILTDPVYSSANHYQLILPLLYKAGAASGENVLRLSSREWMTVFPQPTTTVLLPIPVVHSIWHTHAIASETEYVMDEDSLAEIDRALCEYFSLPAPEENG